MPKDCDAKCVERTVERVCRAQGLIVVRRGSLSQYPGSIHWHFWGFRTMTIGVPGHADHPFRDDGDHDSGMKPITRSEMMPIS